MQATGWTQTARRAGRRVLATATLDRLLHHCDVISSNGPSYRLKNRLAAIERDQECAAW
ncbi:ATP-binding protein [Streptomyces sp. NBC_00190]|uniref:ATP-binding protein n=1 Tax=Streptomyces sp. NBC_00190 TaxID=2903634 RepID=UPI002E2C5393|nr:ATP-binding protein [Streptomyces sp. NBC_00190]